MNLTSSFNDIELRYRPALEAFFIEEWGETRLWSHDLSHHMRVWNFAKELLGYIKTEDIDPLFVQKLLIACLLHDLGMAKDMGERHGLHSMMLCEEFLLKTNLKKADYSDLLKAIEMHDQKENRNLFNQDRLFQLLSLADDLDAFGNIGIYRYLEIYLIRGISPLHIGYKILLNARSRFDNFKNYFGVNSLIVTNHLKRFTILEEFFNGYNKQITDLNTNEDLFTGYYSAVRTIAENSKNGRTVNELLHHDTDKVLDPILREFILNLGSELQ
jgi:hypothetical protein